MKHLMCVLLGVTLALGLSACGPEDPGPEETPANAPGPTIATSFEPTRWLLEQLLGDAGTVVVPLSADADPAYWQPTPEGMKAFQEADLAVFNGASFEKWVPKVALPRAKTFRTAAELDEDFIYHEGGAAHQHGSDGPVHTHAGKDGHTWVDPKTLARQAKNLYERLLVDFPHIHAALDAGKAKLMSTLDALHKDFARINAPSGGEIIVASHPAYDYLARRMGWTMHNLDLDPEEVPSDEALDAIAKALEGKTAKWILWESEPLAEAAKKIEARLGLKSLLFEPAEGVSAEEVANGTNFLTIMQANVKRLQKAWGTK